MLLEVRPYFLSILKVLKQLVDDNPTKFKPRFYLSKYLQKELINYLEANSPAFSFQQSKFSHIISTT